MTDKKNSRRKLLKSIAAGSGAVVAGKSLPESWSKPVINSIVLPSHAALTDDSGNLPGDGTTTTAPTTTPVATTTPACCLISQTYCAHDPASGANLEIEVTAANGAVSVDLSGVIPHIPSPVVSVPCSGGDFISTGGGQTIIGHVGCNAASIIGTMTINGSDIWYEATPGNCG